MNHWSEPRYIRWLVAWVALVPVMACVPDPPQPDPAITTGIPTPLRPSSVSASPTVTARPSASATPSSEELVRQTQAAYQIAFDEFQRLARAGGADEPSPKLKEVSEGAYLYLIGGLLRDQRAEGARVEGSASTARSRSAPGKVSQGSDPRLTLEVCEDHGSAVWVEKDGTRTRSGVVGGLVFAKQVGNRVKLVSASTGGVSQCAW